MPLKTAGGGAAVDHPAERRLRLCGTQAWAAVIDVNRNRCRSATTRIPPVRQLGLGRGIHRSVDQIAHHGHHG